MGTSWPTTVTSTPALIIRKVGLKDFLLELQVVHGPVVVILFIASTFLRSRRDGVR